MAKLILKGRRAMVFFLEIDISCHVVGAGVIHRKYPVSTLPRKP